MKPFCCLCQAAFSCCAAMMLCGTAGLLDNGWGNPAGAEGPAANLQAFNATCGVLLLVAGSGLVPTHDAVR